MNTLAINLPGREYPIFIGKGTLARAGEILAGAFEGGKAFIVSDSNVWGLYGDRLESSLRAQGMETERIVLPPGEKSKTMATLEEICDAMLRAGIRRDDMVVALGGGVVGDVAGLAAATYMRGMAFVQVPTTLLAQVDSSVGGKVAVNLREGKNLVGAFHQPKMVLADTSVLKSLPTREFAAGMAEVVKYAAIMDPALMEKLERSPEREVLQADMESIVYRCCDHKRSLVVEDERDYGRRMLLNFGHTFGHGIEKAGQYQRYTHGEAVAIGMALAARAGERLGRCGKGIEERLVALLRALGLPVESDIPVQTLVAHMAADKKNQGQEITLILLEDMGLPVIHKITPTSLVKLMEGE